MRRILLFSALLTLLMLLFLRPKKEILQVDPPEDTWFQTNIVDQDVPVIVKFGAEWCGPCQAMEPELDLVERNLKDRVRVVRIDVDQRPELVRHYQISGIPRTFVMLHGKIVADEVGALRAEKLESMVLSYLD